MHFSSTFFGGVKFFLKKRNAIRRGHKAERTEKELELLSIAGDVLEYFLEESNNRFRKEGDTTE